jgi:hypothetical protein
MGKPSPPLLVNKMARKMFANDRLETTPIFVQVLRKKSPSPSESLQAETLNFRKRLTDRMLVISLEGKKLDNPSLLVDTE